ncbi:unnamed protein product [Spodoptera exigua]|nr:unnamed protein product [Spodoptera exigua]
MTSVSDSPLNRSRNRPVLARYKPCGEATDQRAGNNAFSTLWSDGVVAIILRCSGVGSTGKPRRRRRRVRGAVPARASRLHRRAVKPPPSGTRLERTGIAPH